MVITRRRAATRQRLLAAARAAFAERGMHGATVEDICDAAGFTRGAFYSNFASKEELFLALLRQEEELALSRLAEVVEGRSPAAPAGPAGPATGDPGTAVIEGLVEEFLAAHPLDRQWHLIHTEFRLHAIRDPAAARELARSERHFRGEFARLLEAGLARAGRTLSVPTDDAVTTVLAAFEVAVREVLLRDAAEHADPGLARRTLPLIIRGLSEPVGGR